MSSKYDEIINLPHHISSHRRPMSLYDRAAQFAPFAALAGHDEAIEETARLTTRHIELSDDEKEILSRRLAYAVETNATVTVCYFCADPIKHGGAYLTAHDRVKKLDEHSGQLVLDDGKCIPLADIHSITGAIFNEFIQ